MGLEIAGLEEASGDLSRHVPAAKYTVAVSRVEMTETKGGVNADGSVKPKMPMLKFQFRIQGGDHDGRIVFDQIVVPNPLAKDAANKQNVNRIKKLAVAAGVFSGNTFEYEHLHGKLLQIIVGIRYDKTQVPPAPSNQVEDYLPAES